MKKIMLLATLAAVLCGCATTAATTGSQPARLETGDAMKLPTEFRDLPIEMQQAILNNA